MEINGIICLLIYNYTTKGEKCQNHSVTSNMLSLKFPYTCKFSKSLCIVALSSVISQRATSYVYHSNKTMKLINFISPIISNLAHAQLLQNLLKIGCKIMQQPLPWYITTVIVYMYIYRLYTEV